MNKLTNSDAQDCIRAYPMSEAYGKVKITQDTIAKEDKASLKPEPKSVLMRGVLPLTPYEVEYQKAELAGTKKPRKPKNWPDMILRTDSSTTLIWFRPDRKAVEDIGKKLQAYPPEKREITFPEGIDIADITEQRQKELKQLAILRAKIAVEASNGNGS